MAKPKINAGFENVKNKLDELFEAQSKNTTQIWVYENGNKRQITEEEFEKKFSIKYLRCPQLDLDVSYEFFDRMLLEAQDDAVSEREYRKSSPDREMVEKVLSQIIEEGTFNQLEPAELRDLYGEQLRDGKTARVFIGRVSDVLEDERFDAAGYGLFAGADIKKGQFIGVDTGQIEKHGKNEGHYSWEYGGGYVVNCLKMGNQMRFLNHSKNANVATMNVFYEDMFHLFTIAIRDIPNGSQLLLDYGDAYWEAIGVTPIEL